MVNCSLQSSYIKLYKQFGCCTCFRTFSAKMMILFLRNTKEAVHYIMPWLLHTSNKAIKGSVMGRGSHLVVFCKKCVLKNFTKWTGKNPNQKWNSDWGVFLWTFQKNFKACFWTPPGNGFWKGGGFYFTRTQ